MAIHRERPDLNAERSAVLRIWRENHCLRESSIAVYLRWIEHFKAYCHGRDLDEKTQLTAMGVAAFAKAYAQTRSVCVETARGNAHSALQSWAQALTVLGYTLPRWETPARSKPSGVPLLEDFAEHLHQHRGNAPRTIKKMVSHSTDFLTFLRKRRRRLRHVRLDDVDAFIVDRRQRQSRRTVADVCCSIRAFLRFLHATGRLPADLASSVVAPVVRQGERPFRSLPWSDVRNLLQAVDRSTPVGRRDYALLLLMSTYGLGAGEVIGLTLEAIDWRAETVRIVRPKTGAEIVLPLLPAIARALTVYLRQGRPAHAQSRHLFVRMKVPHERLSASSSVRHIVVKYAQRGGVTSDYLGSHVLRHSHARRQMELGTSAQIIGDILGHRRPESTSAYIRIASDRLRQIALPVPR